MQTHKKTLSLLGALLFALLAGFAANSSLAAESYPHRSASYPIRGTFLTFHRPYASENPSFTQVKEQWRQEFLDMKKVEMDTVVVLSIGRLKGQADNYALDASTLHYLPSDNVVATENLTPMNYRDELRALLELGEEYNVKIYVGLLQTNQAWYAEDVGWKKLMDANRLVMQDILSKYYGSPALAGWYIPQEIELNYHLACVGNPEQSFCKYTNPSLGINYAGKYYGTALVRDLANIINAEEHPKPIIIAPIVRSRQPQSGGTYPALINESNAALTLQTFAEQTNIKIMAVQDGAGANTNQPLLYPAGQNSNNFVPEESEIYKFFAEFRKGIDAANASTGRMYGDAFRLYSDLELFQNNGSGDDTQYPPSDINRIADQIKAVSSHTEGIIAWNYFWHMSKQAAAANPAFSPAASQLYDQYYEKYFVEYITMRKGDRQMALTDQFGNTFNAGGVFDSNPATAQFGNKIYIAGRDTSGAIWINEFNTITKIFSGWKNLKGIFKGDPSMDILPSGQIVISARDLFNSYYVIKLSYSGPIPSWTALGGVFSADPSVAACNNENFGIVGKDDWNALWSFWGSPGSLNGTWKFNGGIIQGSASAVCGADNALYAAAKDSGGNPWVMRTTQAGQTGWHSGQGIISSDPKIAATSDQIYVMGLDTGGQPVYRTFSYGPSANWQGNWRYLGGSLNKFTFSVNENEVNVFGQTNDNTWFKPSFGGWQAILNYPIVTQNHSISAVQ